MNRTLFAALTAVTVACGSSLAPAGAPPSGQSPKLENLMRTTLERVADTEVIVSRVTLGPDAALPAHWHPGEEFAYVLDGSVTLAQPGKDDLTIRAGEAGAVAHEQVHSAKAGPNGAVIVVFRVHESGKPERVLVE